MDENDKIPAANPEHGPLFEELRASIIKHTTGDVQARLLARLAHMETTTSTSSFGTHVSALVEEAEEEAAALGPFMSRLSSLLP